MTTDQRIDRLVERHEALTQSVEILHHEIRDLKDATAALLRIAEIHEARISRSKGMKGTN